MRAVVATRPDALLVILGRIRQKDNLGWSLGFGFWVLDYLGFHCKKNHLLLFKLTTAFRGTTR